MALLPLPLVTVLTQPHNIAISLSYSTFSTTTNSSIGLFSNGKWIVVREILPYYGYASSMENLVKSTPKKEVFFNSDINKYTIVGNEEICYSFLIYSKCQD